MLNSKKCSKAKILFLHLTLSLYALPGFAKEVPLRNVLQMELNQHKVASFDRLTQDWKKKYGPAAFQALLELASDLKSPDPQRYIAFMAAARLGGTSATPNLMRFLRDPSWMLRCAALKILTGLKENGLTAQVLPLLKDPALVVRSQALDTLRVLLPHNPPPDTIQALIQTLENPLNYHGGKAQWVPQKAISLLTELKAFEATPHLIAVLENPKFRKDQDLLSKTIHSLETLVGYPPSSLHTLETKISFWKNKKGL